MAIPAACKIASVASLVDLSDIKDFEAVMGDEGDVILVRCLRSYGAVDEIELPTGRLAKLRIGDTLLGVLGNRDATKAIVGGIPKGGIDVSSKTTLHLLNAGGVIGVAKSFSIERGGSPLPLEPLGIAVKEDGSSVNLRDYAIAPWANKLKKVPPIIMLVSTSMESGKTTTAVEIIYHFVRELGLKVAAVKLTGVARLKDLLAMKDAGAEPCLSFVHAGLPSTTTDREKVIAAAKGLLNFVSRKNPDFIVAEMGGSLFGEGVPYVLSDKEIMRKVKAVVLSAMDEVGAYGGVMLLREKYGIEPLAVTGPATDDIAGVRRVRENTGVPAYNMLKGAGPEKLVKALMEKLKIKRRK